MLGFVKKIFGTAQSRRLKKFQKIVKQINTIEEGYQQLSEDEIKQKVPEFRSRLTQGESLDLLLPEAYALVKNTCRRLCGTCLWLRPEMGHGPLRRSAPWSDCDAQWHHF